MARASRPDQRGKILVLSGPSGVGKTTLYKRLLSELPAELDFSVSMTTRPPRAGEKDGSDYRFVDSPQFEKKIRAGEMAEYATVYGNLYGTPKSEIARIARSGKSCLLDLDVQGGMNILKSYPESVLIFISPPSLDDLKSRITARNQDQPEQVAIRMAKAMEEMSFKKRYHYVVVNDNLERTYHELKTLILKVIRGDSR